MKRALPVAVRNTRTSHASNARIDSVRIAQWSETLKQVTHWPALDA
jgi:hypothetical protein